jgi:hypothetical protein
MYTIWHNTNKLYLHILYMAVASELSSYWGISNGPCTNAVVASPGLNSLRTLTEEQDHSKQCAGPCHTVSVALTGSYATEDITDASSSSSYKIWHKILQNQQWLLAADMDTHFYFGVLHPVACILSRFLEELWLATTLQGVYFIFFVLLGVTYCICLANTVSVVSEVTY